jgi:Raf kinase inhibitor-like YbhB/YbcL family protein
LERAVTPNPYDLLPRLDAFSLTSDDLTDGQPLHSAQVGAEGNTSPQLSWSGFPDSTKSFVVSCFDPDAPSPSGFWHWTVVDLPVDVTELPAGAGDSDDSLPGAAFHVRNDNGERNYTGAAPPPDDQVHRYFFVVHAINTETLGVDADASPAAVALSTVFTSVARAVLVGTSAH